MEILFGNQKWNIIHHDDLFLLNVVPVDQLTSAFTFINLFKTCINYIRNRFLLISKYVKKQVKSGISNASWVIFVYVVWVFLFCCTFWDNSCMIHLSTPIQYVTVYNRCGLFRFKNAVNDFADAARNHTHNLLVG